jgi:hypothetical protein
MNSAQLRFACAFLFLILGAGVASAGTLTGVVHNGTTGAPGAGLDVILIQLQGGMQPVATVKSDAQGHFHFDRPELGGAPMLVRVQYRGVNYHQPVPPGTSSIEVQVFEPTDKPNSVQVATRAIVLQPKGTSLLVGEEYSIQNNTQPPVAYYRPEGTFEFTLPDGAQLSQVSAWSAAGMPVVQGTIEKGKNASAIAFPFRPGENGVRLSYEIAYPSSQTKLHTSSPYTVQRVMLVAPPTVQVLSAGFVPAGNEQGWDIYTRDSVPAGTPLDISVSGTASAPTAGDAPAQEGNSRSEPADTATVQALPGRLADVKWILVGGFSALFMLGLVFLMRRSQPVPAPAVASKESAPVLFTEVDREVKGSLDEIKENLFRLELRRQAGTITEDEYARQRARAEKVLRDLVKG